MAELEFPTDVIRGQQIVTTSYYGLGGDAALIQGFHAMWDATLVAAITVWACNFPDVSINQVGSVAIDSTVAGEWIQLQPTSGYTAISPAGAATLVSPLVITVPGGVAGGVFVDLGNTSAKRLRIRVVATTAGFLRIRPHGKH